MATSPTQQFDPSQASVFLQFALKTADFAANGFFVHTPAHDVQRLIGGKLMTLHYDEISGYAMHISAPQIADLTGNGKAVWDFDAGKARFTFSTQDGSTLCNLAYYLDDNGMPLVDVESATLQINKVGLSPTGDVGSVGFGITMPTPK